MVFPHNSSVRCDYESEVGRWWLARASDPAHGRAYSKTARYIHDSIGRSPRLIVDYACGAGHLLTRLAWRFPHAEVVGLDGSRLLLDLARRRVARMGPGIARRVRLVAAKLPQLSAPDIRADLVVFAFPNLFPARGRQDTLEPGDRVLARALMRDPEDPPDTSAGALRRNRMVSLDLRRMLTRGGLCVRVEYAQVRRDRLLQADLLRIAFEEGSLSQEIEGMHIKPWFRLLASTYVRSGVIEDVYQQTGDESDRRGGYVITVLRAL